MTSLPLKINCSESATVIITNNSLISLPLYCFYSFLSFPFFLSIYGLVGINHLCTSLINIVHVFLSTY